MNLVITWNEPTPIAPCGYTAYYRAKGAPSYSMMTTSGATSGVTASVTIPISAPSSIEGYVTSNCCANNSPGAPFGINTWQPLYVTISVGTSGNTNAYIATVVSSYGNPYNIYVSGNFNSTTPSGTTNIPYTVVYPTGSTSSALEIGVAPAGSVVSTGVITSITPNFDNGGSLQQFDAVYTPQYFAFYDGSTSGVTETGSPSVLPSFTLNAFIPTSQDTFFNVTAGNLLISWAEDTIYGGAVTPYSAITWQIKDPGNNIIGTLVTYPGLLGLNNIVIPLTRVSPSYPLTTSTQFTMVTRWSNNTIINSKVFYLPG